MFHTIAPIKPPLTEKENQGDSHEIKNKELGKKN